MPETTVNPQNPAGGEPTTPQAEPTPKESASQTGEPKKPEEPKEEPKVPLSRFQKVYDEKKKLEMELAQKSSPSQVPQNLSEEELADKQVREYIGRVIDERDVAENSEIQEETRVITEKIDFYKEVDPLVTSDVLIDLAEKYNLDYTVDENGKELHPIDVAYSIWKDFSAKEKSAAETAAKESAKKPSSPSSSIGGDGSPQKGPSPGKSFSQLAEEAKAQLAH